MGAALGRTVDRKPGKAAGRGFQEDSLPDCSKKDIAPQMGQPFLGSAGLASCMRTADPQ